MSRPGEPLRPHHMADRARQIAELSDDPIAFSTLQEGLAYCETSYGYIAYRRVLGVDITLGPPIAAPADRAALIDRFLQTSRRPVFCYLRAADAAQVQAQARTHHGRYLRLAGMGLDRLIDGRALADPATLSKPLRGARKHAQRAGFRVERIEPSALNASQRQALVAITRAYLSHGPLPYEMRFLNRPFTLAYGPLGHPGERLYLLQQAPRGAGQPTLFGYAVLNPWFAGGRITGYLLDIVRCQPTRQWGVYLALVDRLLAELAAEGIHQLSLGFCPLHGASGAITTGALTTGALASLPAARLSPSLSWQVGRLEQYLAAVPYVQRLVEMKAALPGDYEPRYFVSYSGLALPAFAALLAACGVSLSSIIGPRLWSSIVAGWRRGGAGGDQ